MTFGIVVANHFVKLQQIDGVGLQAAQGLVDLPGRALAGAAIDLGHEERFLAVSIAQGLAHADFAGAAVVVPAVVEEVDAFVEGGADDANALLLVLLAAEVISAESDAGHVLAGVAQCAIGNAVLDFGRKHSGQQTPGHGNACGSFQKFAAGKGWLGISHGSVLRRHYPTGKAGCATNT